MPDIDSKLLRIAICSSCAVDQNLTGQVVDLDVQPCGGFD